MVEKSDHVICERSLMVLSNGWKFMNQSLIYPSGRESLFEKVERNISLNILILMLTLKCIKMRETVINSLKTFSKISIPPTTKLNTNFAKFLRRRDYDYPFHPQFTWRKISAHSMQHRTLQSSFSWRNFAVMRINSYKVRYMIVFLVSTIVSKVFVNTKLEICFSLEGQIVPLAL